MFAVEHSGLVIFDEESVFVETIRLHRLEASIEGGPQPAHHDRYGAQFLWMPLATIVVEADTLSLLGVAL